jgi:hypothetical protein
MDQLVGAITPNLMPEQEAPDRDPQVPEIFEKMEVPLHAEIYDVVNFVDMELGPERANATRYYRGDFYGDEEDGRSQVVTTEVRDTVLAMMPSIMRVFFGPKQIVEFIPRRGDAIEQAKQATDTVQYVIKTQNPGYRIFMDAFKDALIRKTGVITWYWDDSIEVTAEDFFNLTEMQLTACLQSYGHESVKVMGKDVQVVTHMVPVQGPQGVVIKPVPQQIPVYHVRVTTKKQKNVAVIHAVPPEEFLICRDARSVQSARCIGTRQLKTVSELIAMGLPEEEISDSVSDTDRLDMNEERLTRLPGISGEVLLNTALNPENVRHILYTMFYLFDADDDGIAERYRVLCLGLDHKIVRVDPWNDELPFAVGCPDPEAHTVIGASISDRTMDTQLISSHVWRNTLDSLAAAIFPRIAFIEGQAAAEDVMNTEIGAPIRMRSANAVQPLTVPFTGAAAFPVMDRLEAMIEKRTGVGRSTIGLEEDALQSVAREGVNATVTAQHAMTELIARNLAEELVKPVMRGVLKLLTKHQDRPMVVRLRNQDFVEVNPSNWDPDMDVEANVALGIANEAKQASLLTAIAQKQEAIIQAMGPTNPLCGLENLYATYKEILELGGYKNVASFFMDPTAAMQQERQNPTPKPPTDAEINAQVEMAKIAERRDDNSAKIELERLKVLLEDDRARDKTEIDALIAAATARAEFGAQIDSAQIKAVTDHKRVVADSLAAAAQVEADKQNAVTQANAQVASAAHAAAGQVGAAQASAQGGDNG